MKRKNRITLAEDATPTPAPAPAPAPAPVPHAPAPAPLPSLRARWPVIVTATVLTVLAAWLLSAAQPKRYRVSAFAAIVPVAGKLGAEDQIRATQALEQRTIVGTVAALVSMPVITDAAISQADRGYALRAVVLPNTNVLRIEVDGASPARAAAIANAVPALLSARTGTLFGLYGVKIVSPASGAELVFPRTGRILAAGLVLGLILGLAIAWLASARS